MKCLYQFVILIIAVNASAQLYPGLTTDYNAVTFKSNNGNANEVVGRGFRLGAFADYPFPNSRFGSSIQISYSFIRGDFNDYAGHINLHYISIPASVFFMPHPQVHLFVGPQFNLLLNQRSVNDKALSIGPSFERADFGIHGALDFQFAKQWSLAFRYYHGFVRNTKSQSVTSSIQKVKNNTSSLNVIGIGVNYFLKTPRKE